MVAGNNINNEYDEDLLSNLDFSTGSLAAISLP